MTIEYSIIFLFGLIIGSFLNVVILRLDDLRSICQTRSRCPHCRHQLSWFDLIPLISFILLKAKCRYCKTDISWQYPVVELGTALIFVLLFSLWGLSAGFLFHAILFSLLVVVFVHDLMTQLVPEEFVWITLILSLAGSWYFDGLGFTNSLIGGIIGGGIFAIPVFVSKEKWMGAGDIKIGMVMGLVLGYPKTIVGLFLAFVLGAVVGLAVIVLKKKTIKDALPFAPFLIVSLILTLFYGDYIIRWYLGEIMLGY